MFNTQPASGILRYLLQTYQPRAIIVTGSYADGTCNAASDFDCWLIGRDSKRVRHDTSIVNGVELQAEIYPYAYFKGMPLHTLKYFSHAVIAYDPEGLAKKFLDQAQPRLHSFPALSAAQKEQAISYLEKLLHRAASQDAHGDLRGHLLLYQSLEYWCDLTDRVFLGAKKTLRLMEKVDAESAKIYHTALHSFTFEAMQAWCRQLRKVYESGANRQYRIFEK